MKERLQRILDILKANEMGISWKTIIGEAPGAEEPGYDDSGWTGGWTALQGKQWETAWLRGRIAASPLISGDMAGKVTTGGSQTVWVNGSKVAEGFQAEFDLPAGDIAKDGAVLSVKIADGSLAYEMPKLLLLSSERVRQIKTIRRGLMFCLGWRDAQPKHAEAINAVLARYADQVDPDAYDSDPRGFWDAVVVANTFLKELDPLAKEYTVHIVPFSHVDLSWGWDFAETKRLSKAMFDEALRIMDEDEGFTFVQDQPPMYVHLEDSATEKAIRRRVEEGRWDMPGSSFSEPESFVPGGESWVRHMMYTKRYFKDRFGKDICVHWAPDNFSGHANTLPQIWKLCGVNYFAFGNWYQAKHGGQFLWEGLDGSRVFAHYFTGHYDSAQMIEQDKTIRHVLSHMSSTALDKCMLLDGDDLCPPWADSPRGIAKLEALAAFPKVEFSTAHRFFDGVDPEAEDLRVLTGELVSIYDERERKNNVGAYSSFMPTKRRNRQCEWSLRTAEALATLAHREGAVYASKHFNRGWRLTLFNQMHDILPGTAIHEAYEEAYKRYDEVDSICLIGSNAVANVLTSGIDTRGEGTPVVVFNTLGWDRDDAAEIALTEIQSYHDGFAAVDSEGRDVPVQVVESDLGTFDKTNRNFRVLIKPEETPAMGHTTVWLRPLPAEERHHSSMVGPDGLSLDNEHLRVRINPRTGWVSELYDKNLRKGLLPDGKEGCALLGYHDFGNPWHLWPEGEPWELNDTVRVEVVEDGDVRAALRVTTESGPSTFVQEFRLYRDSPELEVYVSVDMNHADFLCRMVLPVDIPADAPWTCEVPWGAVERDMPIEKLTFPRREPEVRTNDRATHTWMDVSNEDWGVSVLNNGRYGACRLLDGSMTITVIRTVAAHKSTKQTDQGTCEFTYAVLPHAGSWKTAETVQRAHALNAPMLTYRDIAHEGAKPATAGALSISVPNIVLASLKKAEDNDDWVLHLYETTGTATEATITFDRAIAEASVTDLVEWSKLGEVECTGETLKHSFRPWEIVGIRVRLES